MIARRSYLQKAVLRLTVSFAVNSNGSNILPIRYIGSTKVPTCFRLHLDARKFYSAQINAWMEGNQFRLWLLWWYGEVKDFSSRLWLLI